MAISYEKISEHQNQGRTDSNLANDSNHLGGLPADEYATKEWVKDYHTDGEKSQKEYIDKQDKAILDKAKEYTNTEIRNIDFSEMAKTQDVKTLQEALNKKIEEGLTNQQNYTDTKVSGVVTDVNKNFEDVKKSVTTLNTNLGNLKTDVDNYKKTTNQTITDIKQDIKNIPTVDLTEVKADIKTLQDEQKDLFSSVSNGKSKIAEAITDKGVETSANATFEVMANSIRNIDTSSGGGGGSGDIDTSDATAQHYHILSGYTAYARGKKLYGTYVPPQPAGTDTSDATATEKDIIIGKTAYANGRKIIGTLQNVDIKEIYGLSEKEYSVAQVKEYTEKKVDENGQYTMNQGIFGISPYADFILNWVKLYDGEDNFLGNYIEIQYLSGNNMSSKPFNKEEVKKYRYSFEELGLNTEKDLFTITIGDTFLYGTGYTCITQQNESNETVAHMIVYSYGYNQNTYVFLGQDAQNKHNEHFPEGLFHLNIWHLISSSLKDGDSSATIPRKVIKSNLDPYTFAMYMQSGGEFMYGSRLVLIKVPYYFSSDKNIQVEYLNHGESFSDKVYLQFSDDDEFLIFNRNTSNYGHGPVSTIVKINTSSIGYSFSTYANNSYNVTLLPFTFFVLIQGYKYAVIYDERKNSLTLTKQSEKQYIQDVDENKYYFTKSFSNGQYIFRNNTNNNFKVYKVNWDEEDWQPVQEGYLNIDLNHLEFYCNDDSSNLYFGSTKKLYKFSKELDKKNIIAVKYKGKCFTSLEKMELTANSQYVKKGKTFIGSNAYPEVGELE